MKQSINFLTATTALPRQRHTMLIVAVWVFTFFILFFWAGAQKNKLQEINRQVEAIQAQNQIIKDKIKTLSRVATNTVEELDSIASPAIYPPIHLTKYLNQIAKNYVQGTTIDYIHIQGEQKILIEGRALHSGLVTEVIDRWLPFEEKPFMIKVKNINPQKNYIVFSIKAE